jgi:hypothetical protein
MNLKMIGLLLFLSSSLLGLSYSANARGAISDSLTAPKKKTSSKLLLVTRIHAANASSFPPNEVVQRFITSNKPYVSEILIVLGAKSLEELQIQLEKYSQLVHDLDLTAVVTILPVFPWGYFTSALNQAILFGVDKQFDLLAFQVIFVDVFLVKSVYLFS